MEGILLKVGSSDQNIDLALAQGLERASRYKSEQNSLADLKDNYIKMKNDKCK